MPRKRSRSSYSRGPVGLGRFLAAPEKKFKDDFVAVSVAPAATQVQMVGKDITDGSGAQNKVGSKIALHSLAVKLKLLPAGAYGNATQDMGPCAFRIVLLVDRQANGSTPTWADVIDQVNSTNSVIGMRNMDNTARFRILYDRVHKLQRYMGASSTTQNNLMSTQNEVSIYKSFKKPLIRRYYPSTTSGQSTTVEKNNIWLLILSDVNNDANVSGEFQSRIRFSDS